MILQHNRVSASGQGERVVTVFDGEVEQTFVTTAVTVQEALQRVNITINEHDAIEPQLETELVAQNYNINIYRARPVMVIDGETRLNVMSPHKSARQVAEKAGLELYAEDETAIERVSSIESESIATQKIIVDRAKPFQIVLYGKKSDIRTQAETVADFMKEKNIILGPADGVSMTVDRPIVAGMLLEIWRDGKQTITEEQDVAFPVRQIQDRDREIGFKEIKTAGKNGRRAVTFEIDMRNGKEVSRKEVQSVVITEPSEQVELVGVKSLGFDGPLGEAMAKLRSCEAGGVYSRNSGNGYYGAYQYDISTWANYGGFRIPSDAPGPVQDAKALETYNRRGWQPWPGCTRKLGLQDIYR